MSTSAEALAWAWRQQMPTGVPATAKFVLCAIAGETHRIDGGPYEAKPGQAKLAQLTGLNESTIVTLIRHLVKHGFAERVKGPPDERGHRSRDTFTLPVVVATSTPSIGESKVGESKVGKPKVGEPRVGKRSPSNPDTTGQPCENQGWMLQEQVLTTKEQRTKKSPTDSSARTRKRTDRDDLWDAVAAACGVTTSELPKSTRAAFGKVVNELHEVGAIPGQVKVRAARYRQRYEGRAALTPTALLNHWAALGEQFQPPETPSRGADVHDFAALREQQAAEAAARRERANAWMANSD